MFENVQEIDEECAANDENDVSDSNLWLHNKNAEEADGSFEASNCPHKRKKRLFRMAPLRKKLKANFKNNFFISSCDDCARLDPPKNTAADWICVSCSFFGCDQEKHALQHFKALRTDLEHSIFLFRETDQFRCFSCDINLTSINDNRSPMRLFLNDYHSFLKNKLKSDSKSKSKNEENCPQNGNDAIMVVSNSKEIAECTARKKEKKLLLPVKGLVNLGNTCFFNSIVQCLFHTHLLGIYIDLVGQSNEMQTLEKKIIINGEEIKIPSVKLILPHFNGVLNKIFANFLRDFQANKDVHPSVLFSEISKRAPRFRGWVQQDAHELLRYLLDGLRAEELSRYKEAISKYFKSLNTDSKDANGRQNIIAREMLNFCRRPLLDSVFGGTLLQTVKCSECGHLSLTFEEFLDLSLPLPSTSSSTQKMHKSTSLTLSKHQRKKEKALARKGQSKRRSSHGDLNRDGYTYISTGPSNSVNSSNEELDSTGINRDEKISSAAKVCSDDLSTEMGRMILNADSDCLRLLNEELSADFESNTLSSCLRAFTDTEILSSPNTYECEKCCLPLNKKLINSKKKKTVEAAKRYLIYEPPPILTLHLKRFEQIHSNSGRMSTRKVGVQIYFPKILDIAPFCTRVAKRIRKGEKRVIYSLYGIVSHSGDLSGGHYVAFIHNRPPSMKARKYFFEAANLPSDQLNGFYATNNFNCSDEEAVDGEWFYASDTRISSVSESRALSAEGYILFYERIS